jgi:uncharacterized protein YhbP (UPF0306 family)
MAVVDNGVCTRYEGHIFMNEMTYVFDILNTNLYKYMGKTRLLQVLYNNSIHIVSCVNLF